MGAACMVAACGSKNGGYDASGVFETTEVTVSAKGTGEIRQLAVEEGWLVTSETCLGYIDTTQLYLKKRQLEATLRSTDSRYLDENRQLAALRQQIAIQQRERERFANLVQAKAASQKQLDDIDYQLEVLARQLAATAEQLGSSNASLSGQSGSILAQLAQLDDQIANNRIYSPVEGTVLTKYAEPGEFAVPGRPLFKVGNLAGMKLRAYITAGQLTQLKVGQPVTVYADEGEAGRREYPGVVSWISDKAEFTPKTIQTRDERANLVYAVKVAVRNDGYIKKGMYGEIKF